MAQNFGAGKRERICQGVRASLIQTETFNVLMCAGIILLRHPIVELFMSNPTKEIYHYSDAYLTIVAPFYVILGLLLCIVLLFRVCRMAGHHLQRV